MNISHGAINQYRNYQVNKARMS